MLPEFILEVYMRKKSVSGRPSLAKPRFAVEKELAKLSLPILVGMIFELVCSLLDMFWIARINPQDTGIVSGVGLAYPVTFLLVALAQGVSAGIATIVAVSAGRNDTACTRSAAKNGFVLSFALSAVIIALVYAFQGSLIGALSGSGISQSARGYGSEYLTWYMPGMLFLFCGQSYLAVLQGEGRTKHIGLATSISTAINAILDPIFIFVFGLGVKGAAMTTSIAQVLIFAYAAVMMLKDKKATANESPRFDFGVIKRILKLGMPQSLSFVVLSASFAVVNWFVGSISETFMQSYTIVSRFDGILLTPTLAFSIGLSIMVGQSYGAGDIPSMRLAFKRGTMLNMAISVSVGVLYMLLARPLFATMSENGEVISLALKQVYGFTIAAVAGSVLGLCSGSALQAVERSVASMTVMLLRMLLLPVAALLILQLIFGATVETIWFAVAGGSLLGGFIGLLMVRLRFRKIPEVLTPKAAPAQ
jgi:putative MATE family efflux protein